MMHDDFTTTPDAAEAFERNRVEPDHPDRADWWADDDPAEKERSAWALYQSMTPEQRATWFPWVGRVA